MKYSVKAKKLETTQAWFKFVDLEMTLEMEDKGISILIKPKKDPIWRFNKIEEAVFEECKRLIERKNIREWLLKHLSGYTHDSDEITDAVISYLKLEDYLAKWREVVDIFYDSISSIEWWPFVWLPSKTKKPLLVTGSSPEKKQAEKKQAVKKQAEKKETVLTWSIITEEEQQKDNQEISTQVPLTVDKLPVWVSYWKYTIIDLNKTATSLNVPL